MELICFEIQNDGVEGFERQDSTINLVVNQIGEESMTVSSKKVVFHNCTIRNLDTLSDNYNTYFSVYDSLDSKSVVVESNKYDLIKVTREID